MLRKLYGICYEDIPDFLLDEIDNNNMNRTGLYSIEKDSEFGVWLISQGFVFDHGSWGWIAIWN